MALPPVIYVSPQQLHFEENMSERLLMSHVRSLCNTLDLLVQHSGDARRDWVPGWPDLVIIGPNGQRFAELKARFGQLDTAQCYVRDRLIAAGLEWRLWTPRDWYRGTIAAELIEISGNDYARM